MASMNLKQHIADKMLPARLLCRLVPRVAPRTSAARQGWSPCTWMCSPPPPWTPEFLMLCYLIRWELVQLTDSAHKICQCTGDIDSISQVSYYGNPHSRTHQYGWESEKAMEVAREQVTLYKQTEPSGYSNITKDDSDHTDHFPRLLDSLELIRRRLSGQAAPQSRTILQSREWADSIRARRSTSSQRKLNTSAKEYCHKIPMAITLILRCVLDSCRILESEGIDVTYLPVLPR